MKTIILLLLTSTLVINAQKPIDLHLSKTDKMIITPIFAAGAFYEILKPGCTNQDKILAGLFAASACLPYIEKLNVKNIHVNASGINFDLKFKKSKCYYNPLKRKL